MNRFLHSQMTALKHPSDIEPPSIPRANIKLINIQYKQTPNLFCVICIFNGVIYSLFVSYLVAFNKNNFVNWLYFIFQQFPSLIIKFLSI